jgi:LemA protein
LRHDSLQRDSLTSNTQHPPVSSTVITLILCAVLVFWALGAYNRLVRLRSQVMRSLQLLAQLWQAQAMAIHTQLDAYAQGRETESQWAALDDDAPRWRPVTLAARQFMACVAVLQAKPQQTAALDDISSVRAARDIFESHWQRLRETQDDLAGSAMPPELEVIWAQHEGSVQQHLRDYNEAVDRYHEAIGQFPALLLAWVFGFSMTGRL